MPGRDPFLFRSGRRCSSSSAPGGGAPLVVIAEPGQEIRVVVPGSSGEVPGLPGDSRISPKPSSDSRISPKPSPDSRISPKPSPDSGQNPAGRDPFRLGPLDQPAYSPRPVTIVAQPGQEIRVVVRDQARSQSELPADSRISPKPSPDRRGRRKRSG